LLVVGRLFGAVEAKLPHGQRLRNDDFEFVLLSPGMVDIKTQEPALLFGVGGRVGQREMLLSSRSCRQSLCRECLTAGAYRDD
jgi:hypothetical protein